VNDWAQYYVAIAFTQNRLFGLFFLLGLVLVKPACMPLEFFKDFAFVY
jgi:hypothetical protein